MKVTDLLKDPVIGQVLFVWRQIFLYYIPDTQDETVYNAQEYWCS